MRGKFDIEKHVPWLVEAGMDRLEKAGDVIRDQARANLRNHSKIHYKWREHGPYKTGKSAGEDWTARHYYDMEKTVRTVRQYDEKIGLSRVFGRNRNIRIYAGKKEIWYAKQMEYGRGGWKGGRRSFFRPALNRTRNQVRGIIENG